MNGYDIETLTKFGKDVRILYIEDNAGEREVTLGIFNIFFNNIDIASNGKEGLEYFEKNRYDLIITGIEMPEMGGIEFITRIREVSKHITILVISSSSQKKDFLNLIKLGIDGYILKPVEIDQFITVLQKTVEKLQNKHELYEYRISLEKKVQEEVEKRLNSEKILAYQSKLAAMGEMMDVVAHQWKQPINIMSMYVDFLQYQYEDGKLDMEAIKEFQGKFKDQKDHIIETLQEFRDFFRPNKQKEDFLISDCIDSVLLLTKDEFIKNKINIELDIQDDFELSGIKNEFKHTILNIINNAKDEFVEKDLDSRIIEIATNKKDDKKVLYIKDNAGGIPEHIIDNIFKSNVTGKAEGKGTGMGLYMSHQIVEKMGGVIKAGNVENGAMFTIELN